MLPTDGLSTMRGLAARQPLGVDISDYGDEWCAGFLAGQVAALDAISWHLRTRMDVLIGTHGVGEMTEQLAQLLAEINGA